jgi:carboxyl-terminal processing protease
MKSLFLFHMFVAYCVAFHQPSSNSHADQRQRPFVGSESIFQSAHQQDGEIFSSCCKTAGAIALSTVLTFSPFALDLTTPDFHFPLTSTTTTTTSINRNNHFFRIEKPSAWALTEEQLLVDNVWREVNRQYVDQSFNKLGEEGWRKARLKAVQQVSNVGPDEKEFVYSTIRNMLAVLGDPYTRFLTPDQFESLTAYARGGAAPKAGIGVQLIADPVTGKIIVLNVIPDGPAAKVGMLPGDIIFQVDDDDMSGSTAEVVAAKCRGETGTEVTLAIQHGSEDGKPKTSVENLSVTRLQIKTTSVQTSTYSSNSGKKIGLIRVSSFNLETEKLVMEALEEIRKSSSVSSLVIDLRGNPGGYMPAGVDVAKLFLPAQARIISEVDKTGRSTIYISDGVGSDTNMQLYLLVDQRTASASEILTAALQDNHRATIVGTQTFGKG